MKARPSVLTFAVIAVTSSAYAEPMQTRMGFEADGQPGRIVISEVLAQSAAARAGLRVGDVVIGYETFNSEIQSSWSWTVDALRTNERSAGTLTLLVARTGAAQPQKITMTATSVALSPRAPRPRHWTLGPPGRHYIGFGLGIDDGELATCQTERDCVVVKRVFAPSSAKAQGVQPGDCVVRYAGLRPAEEIATKGAAGLAFVLEQLRGQATLGSKLQVRMFRPGAGEYEVDLTAGWVTDPVVPPPPECVASAKEFTTLLEEGCTGDAACRKTLDTARGQLQTLEACTREAPSDHRGYLTERLAVARAVVDKRATEEVELAKLALPDTACAGLPTFELRATPIQREVPTLAEQARLLACMRPGRAALEVFFGAWSALLYLTSSDHAGSDPLLVALALNVHVRAIVPERERRFAPLVGGLLAGYPRVVSVAAMKEALARAFDADIASRLAAGVDAGLAATRSVPEAKLWAEWATYAKEAASVQPLLDEIRAQRESGDAEALLARLDAARMQLLRVAKSRPAAMRSPAFRELSALARWIAASRGIRRPFEQALEEPFHPTSAFAATTSDPGAFGHRFTEAVSEGRALSRATEWPPERSDVATYVMPITRFGKVSNGQVTVHFDNRQTNSYAGECRTVLLFIDAAGQGWGKEKCSKSATISTERGPTSATVPAAQLAGAKAGRLLTIIAKPDGTDAYPVGVTDASGEKPLAVGPFEL